MKTSKKRKKNVLTRLYLILDKYMSGAFLPLFGWTLLLSTFLFLLLWGIFYCVTGWNPGDAFLQLTNPSTGNDNYASGWEWLEIVVMNLFGLFILNA